MFHDGDGEGRENKDRKKAKNRSKNPVVVGGLGSRLAFRIAC